MPDLTSLLRPGPEQVAVTWLPATLPGQAVTLLMPVAYARDLLGDDIQPGGSYLIPWSPAPTAEVPRA